MGLDKLTNAFGLLLLFQGIAAAIGSPLAGTKINVDVRLMNNVTFYNLPDHSKYYYHS
jgi:hypothetical protein